MLNFAVFDMYAMQKSPLFAEFFLPGIYLLFDFSQKMLFSKDKKTFSFKKILK